MRKERLLCPSQKYDFKNKDRNIDDMLRYMLRRSTQMFKYNGLPKTIPKYILELYLQTNGNVCFYKHDGELYVFTGGMGGELNEYYLPTIYTIANPFLKLTKNLVIDKDCVVVANDSCYQGMLPQFKKYATGLVENELSMNIASINSRIISLISASDDRTLKSAEAYVKRIYDGDLSIVSEDAFLDGVKVQPYAKATNDTLSKLIEYNQYLKASWFNDIGLNANYNMKREAINSNESQLNDDMLFPTVDDMLERRKEGLEKVNEMYATNITVELNSSWRYNVDEINDSVQTENETEVLDNEIE
jgi:hypothetical protein